MIERIYLFISKLKGIVCLLSIHCIGWYQKPKYNFPDHTYYVSLMSTNSLLLAISSIGILINLCIYYYLEIKDTGTIFSVSFN